MFNLPATLDEIAAIIVCFDDYGYPLSTLVEIAALRLPSRDQSNVALAMAMVAGMQRRPSNDVFVGVPNDINVALDRLIALCRQADVAMSL